MKFVLFIEGYTERAVPKFLKRWLDDKLSRPVGVQAVRFEGWAEMVKDAPLKAGLYLNAPKGDMNCRLRASRPVRTCAALPGGQNHGGRKVRLG